MADLDALTVEELRELADEQHVHVPSDARKADIIDLLTAEVAPEVITERTTTTVRVDRDGYAEVNGERRFFGLTLAGAEVTVRS